MKISRKGRHERDSSLSQKKKRSRSSSSSSSSSSTSTSGSSSSSSISNSTSSNSSSSSGSSSSSVSDMKYKKGHAKHKRARISSSKKCISSNKSKLKEKKKHSKHAKILKRKLKKKHEVEDNKSKLVDNCNEEDISTDVPLNLMNQSKSMVPMTKEQWEKQQSVMKKVYDESSGRHRLIKGDGEVIEEIVSKEQHKKINQQATQGDGDYFQKKLSLSNS